MLIITLKQNGEIRTTWWAIKAGREREFPLVGIRGDAIDPVLFTDEVLHIVAIEASEAEQQRILSTIRDVPRLVHTKQWIKWFGPDAQFIIANL